MEIATFIPTIGFLLTVFYLFVIIGSIVAHSEVLRVDYIWVRLRKKPLPETLDGFVFPATHVCLYELVRPSTTATEKDGDIAN